MNYYATIGELGVIVRAAGSIEEFARPEDWTEVSGIRRHANEDGIRALDAGKIMTFTRSDQSYPELVALCSGDEE